ncbi:hypothetical protein TrLO_g4439 [Triparma laevis f. longispina]|uniref:SMODS and SLOG-associating 2TM effector domain-containing protein n=1 Tax=Triparma laevis f. longispina TaxID=1714387 RepID=A0A9W7FTD4_9STRA|nr:hypothetical protein TrLO_g4439 [Triparma laevis f. longispina]
MFRKTSMSKGTIATHSMQHSYVDNITPSPTLSSSESLMTRTMLTAVDFKFAGPGGRTNSAIFVPNKISTKQLMSIVEEVWRIPTANMLISIDAGSAHPTLLATNDLCASKQYEPWAKEGLQQIRSQSESSSRSPNPPPVSSSSSNDMDLSSAAFQSPSEPPNREDLKKGGIEMKKTEGGENAESRSPSFTFSEPQSTPGNQEVSSQQINVINKLLFQKLITVFCAILDAAAMSNNWIIIDRTRAIESSATAELILEFAIRQTNQRPAIIVIESLKRFREFTSEKTRSHLQDLNELAAKSRPITSDGIDNESAEVQVIPLPYNPEDYEDSKPFEDGDLPCKAFKEHIRADTKDVAPKRKWMYHYNQTTFSSGTHYVFLESDTEAFPLHAFGPTGYVHAHGGTLSYQRLRSRISQGRPLVMLHQTGGVSQAFGSLHKSIGHMSADSMKSTDQILAEIDLFSSEKWAAGFGVPEIMMFKELLSRAPQLFQKTILSVDLVKASAEEVLTAVTGCFASTTSGIPELGLGDAEMNMVFNAWERHVILWNNAKIIRNRAHIMYFLLTLIALSTALCSVLYANVEISGTVEVQGVSMDHKSFESFLGKALIVFPVVTALVSTIRTRMRFVDKWKICELASFQIVQEIYHFRTRTFKYSPSSLSSGDGKDDKGKEKENGGGKGSKLSQANNAHLARSRFSQRVQDIWSTVLESDVGTSGTLIYQSAKMYDSTNRSKFHEMLKTHINSNLFKHSKESKEKKKPFCSIMCCSSEDQSLVEEDDLVSPMSIEMYVKSRALPVLHHFRSISPRLSSSSSWIEVLGFCVTSLGALLAVMEYGEWIALVVAIGALLQNVSEYFGFARERSAVNAGLKDVENMLSWWESLSVVDRRTTASKQIAVGMTEGSFMVWAGARTSSAANMQGSSVGDTIDDAEAEGGEE